MAFAHPGTKWNKGAQRKTGNGRRENGKTIARKKVIARKRKPAKTNRKPVPQKVLIHAARTLPTPEIFNEVPDEMPFPTGD